MQRAAWPKPQFNGATKIFVGNLLVVIGRNCIKICSAIYKKKI